MHGAVARLSYTGVREINKPYALIGFGAVDVAKSYEFIWFGDIHGPKPYKFIGFRWAFMSQTSLFKSFGSSSEHTEIGPESFGTDVCRFVGTVPNWVLLGSN